MLAKHTKHVSLVDVLSIGDGRIQRNFEPMKKQVEVWKAPRIPDEASKLVIYGVFVECESQENAGPAQEDEQTRPSIQPPLTLVGKHTDRTSERFVGSKHRGRHVWLGNRSESVPFRRTSDDSRKVKRFLGYEVDQTVAALARGSFLLSPAFNSLISSKPSLTVVFTVPGSIRWQPHHSEDVFGAPFGIDGRSFLLI